MSKRHMAYVETAYSPCQFSIGRPARFNLISHKGERMSPIDKGTSCNFILTLLDTWSRKPSSRFFIARLFWCSVAR
jgi:hypothetical protein